jgi:hypothetical protein
MLSAQLAGATLEDVLLTWQPSPDDGGGQNDVSAYEIWHGDTYDPTANSYSLLASVPAGTTSYVHVGAGVGDPSEYFYQVRAIDGDGNSTPAAEQAGKFALFLAAGHRLISVPLEQATWDIDVVLQTISWTRARTYVNLAGQGKNWLSNDKQKVWADLTTLDREMALWVEVSADSWWTLAGLVPAQTQIALKVGWNFVGYPSFISRTVEEVLAGVSYQTVESYAEDPPFYLGRLSSLDMMVAGNGYWVHVSTDAIIEVMNQ